MAEGADDTPCTGPGPLWWQEDHLPSGLSELGLSSEQARTQLARHGPNLLSDQISRPLVLEFLRRFRNPLVILLLGASGISALDGDRASFGIILAMVLCSVCLDFFQEHRAGRAVAALRQSVAVRASV